MIELTCVYLSPRFSIRLKSKNNEAWFFQLIRCFDSPNVFQRKWKEWIFLEFPAAVTHNHMSVFLNVIEKRDLTLIREKYVWNQPLYFRERNFKFFISVVCSCCLYDGIDIISRSREYELVFNIY